MAAAQRIVARPRRRRRGQPAPGRLSDSLYFLFNHRSLRDVLPSIHHTEKKFSTSILTLTLERNDTRIGAMD
ncbi:hypothetical protein EYF80_018554 [Liparis tanakae]|uniref:Uncharacterized protein n=1 Tax=Liparis tanakae TaxID=230148 RepID=A0A4Z2HZJ2_9TELE|nr:hypothetical protein EYF80_018554 [Liparis tanakae]